MQFLAQAFLRVLTRCWPVSLKSNLVDKAKIVLGCKIIQFLSVTKPNLSYASLATHGFKTENVILTQAGDAQMAGLALSGR